MGISHTCLTTGSLHPSTPVPRLRHFSMVVAAWRYRYFSGEPGPGEPYQAWSTSRRDPTQRYAPDERSMTPRSVRVCERAGVPRQFKCRQTDGTTTSNEVPTPASHMKWVIRSCWHERRTYGVHAYVRSAEHIRNMQGPPKQSVSSLSGGKTVRGMDDHGRTKSEIRGRPRASRRPGNSISCSHGRGKPERRLRA